MGLALALGFPAGSVPKRSSSSSRKPPLGRLCPGLLLVEEETLQAAYRRGPQEPGFCKPPWAGEKLAGTWALSPCGGKERRVFKVRKS